MANIVGLIGCQSAVRIPVPLPDTRQTINKQLVVHSDFYLPKNHQLIEELVDRRDDISTDLEIPVSDEPIHIYLFSDQQQFSGYMKRHHPAFPNRRAFFIKTDGQLVVYAFWGERVAEDLRHEVTHGYLHSVVPNIPLWLDEGLAEYYETPRQQNGLHPSHLRLLLDQFRQTGWQPDLVRLEKLTNARELTQLDYAESWLWVHFLLNSKPSTKVQTNSLLRRSLTECQQQTEQNMLLSRLIESHLPDSHQQLIEHLITLAPR